MENFQYNLFLDDLRTPLDTFTYKPDRIYCDEPWEIVRNYSEFVSHILKYGLPAVVSFDHDLCDFHYKIYDQGLPLDYDSLEEKTGYCCAKWLINYCIEMGYIDIPQFMIHTMNPVGGVRIRNILNDYSKNRNKLKE